MGVGALFKADLVEWLTCTTYQAASGGGAQHMRELLTQYGTLNAEVRPLLDDPASAILDIDRQVLARQRSMSGDETATFGVPLAAASFRGSTPTAATAPASRNGRAAPRPTRSSAGAPDSARGRRRSIRLCVRVGAMRCHSQALTFKLKRDVPLADIEAMIAADNEWVKLVPNTREASVRAADAGGGDRHDVDPGRPAAQAGDGAAISRRLYGRRSVAVGRGRTAAAHAADRARCMSFRVSLRAGGVGPQREDPARLGFRRRHAPSGKGACAYQP